MYIVYFILLFVLLKLFLVGILEFYLLFKLNKSILFRNDPGELNRIRMILLDNDKFCYGLSYYIGYKSIDILLNKVDFTSKSYVLTTKF